VSTRGLTSLQLRVLSVLADLQPQALLFGGAALVVACNSPRPTRDLDLLWLHTELLGNIPVIIDAKMRGAGLEIRREVTSPAFVRSTVSDGVDSIELDLVADPGPGPQHIAIVAIGTDRWQVPSRADLLVDKLCALLSRTEIRDLQDVQFLLDAGEDLATAPQRDAGFSALTLAWTVRGWPVEVIARHSGVDADEAVRLMAFRDALVQQLLATATFA
jgi:hypothetical protein